MLELQAAVYNYDTNLKTWVAKDAGASRIWIFHNQTTSAYRVIGQSVADKQYNVNSPIKGDLVHKKLRDNFVQWRFRQTIFGLSFISTEDADKFVSMLAQLVQMIAATQPAEPEMSSDATLRVRAITSDITAPGKATMSRTAHSATSGDTRKTQSMYGVAPVLPGSFSSQTASHMGTIRSPLSGGGSGIVAPSSSGGVKLPEQDLSGALFVKENKDLGIRDYRAKEIYTTEESYLASLDIVLKDYLLPAKTKGVFNDKEIRTIFSNIEQIRDLSRELFTAIRQQMLNWTDQCMVGDIFTRNMPFMKIYIPYCRDHKAANELIENKKENKKMVMFLKECQVASGSALDINALLITPVQRVLRYPLLLKALVEVTDPSHPDYSHLQTAVEGIQKIADEINQSVEVSESTKAVHELAKQIPNIHKMISTNRQLIKHGPVSVTSPNKSQYTYLLLFSDVAVFASPSPKSAKKLDMKEIVQLEQVWVDAMKDTSSAELMWQLNAPGNTFLVASANREDKTLWVDRCHQRIVATCQKNRVMEGERRKFQFEFKDGAIYDGTWIDAKFDGMGKQCFADKGVYEGEWERGKFHGQGKMVWATGESFEGQWVKDKFHGTGKLTTLLCTYTGGWEMGRRHGAGTITWTNGDSFEGTFVNDLRDGMGVMKYSDGNSYEGEWKDDKYHGRGKLVTLFSGTYDGEWSMGRKNGQGKMTYTNGDVYTGGWVNDFREGKGQFTSLDKKVKYDGDWKDDVMEGTGVYIKPGFKYEGELRGGRLYGQGTLDTAEGTYIGQWAEDRKEGKGEWDGDNGETYDGEWHSDLRFGKGTWIDTDGARYDGKWVKGRKEGSGVMTYANGSKYSGNWQRDRRHGKGVFTTPDESTKYVGDWVNDVREGKGILTDATGVYNGDWVNDMRNGQGTFTYTNGMTYTGEWKDDRRHGEGVLKLAEAKNEKDGIIRVIYEQGLLIEPPFSQCPPDVTLPRVVVQK